MGVYQIPLAAAAPSQFPYARHGRLFHQPIIDIYVRGPRGRHPVSAVLDTGAECCLFPEWVAWRIGLRQTPAAPTGLMGSSLSRTGWNAWFATVELELEDPARILPPYRWSAVVGFTGTGSFKGRHNGILGVNGGLDAFQRVEFDWSALAGPEVVVRA
jgi:Aspartyl protease